MIIVLTTHLLAKTSPSTTNARRQLSSTLTPVVAARVLLRHRTRKFEACRFSALRWSVEKITELVIKSYGVIHN